MFAFRITTNYSDFSKNNDFPNLLNSCERYVIYEHIPDGNETNVHIHGLIVNPMYISKGQLIKDTPEHMRRAYFAKYYTNKYSIKVCDDEEHYIIYMSKGHIDPSVWYNLPGGEKLYCDQHFKNVKEMWVDPKKINLKLVDGKLVRELGKNKLSKRELIDIMLADYRTEMPMEGVVRLIRKTLVKNNEVLGMYKVIDYYDALLMYGNKEDFCALICSKINSRVRV